jgi:hypothetical protein
MDHADLIQRRVVMSGTKRGRGVAGGHEPIRMMDYHPLHEAADLLQRAALFGPAHQVQEHTQRAVELHHKLGLVLGEIVGLVDESLSPIFRKLEEIELDALA